MGKISSGFVRAIIACCLLLGVINPAGAAPSESGVYTEDFSTYDHVDYTDQVVWDKFSPQLRLRRTNGFDIGYWFFYGDLAWIDNESFYVVWTDLHTASYALNMQKLDANGNRLWPDDLLVGEGEIADIAVDSQGNALVVWRSPSGAYLKKISPEGVTLLEAMPLPGCGDSPIIFPTSDYTGFWVSCRAQVNPDASNYYAILLDGDDLEHFLYAGQINVELAQGNNLGYYSMVVDADGVLWAAWHHSLDWTNYEIRLQALNPGDGSRKWAQDQVVASGEFPTLSPAPGGGVYLKSPGSLQRLNPDGTPAWVQPLAIALGDNDTSFDTDVQGNLWIARGNGSDISVQKISPAGELLFPDPIWIRSTNFRYGIFPKIRVNSNGNAAVVFADNRNEVYELRLQMLTGDGELFWPSEKLFTDDFGTALQNSPAVDVADDGTSYLAWKDARLGSTQIFIQSLDGSGVRRWGADLLVNTPAPDTQVSLPRVVVLDTNQTILVGWFQGLNISYQGSLYLQKFDRNGNRLWPEAWHLLDVDFYHPLLVTPNLAASGDGGFIAAWTNASTLHVQRFDSEGAALWPSEFTYQGDGTTVNQYVAIAAAPDGGVYVAFTIGLTIYLIHLDANGKASWLQPVAIYTQTHNAPSFTLAADGAGNAIPAWSDSGMTMSQKISPAGQKLWNNGNFVEIGSFGPNAATALIAPGDRPTYVGVNTVFLRGVQLDANGTLLWDNQYTIVESPSFVPMGTAGFNTFGDFIAAWEDVRNGNMDVYLQKLQADGSLGWADPVQVVTPDLFYARQGRAQSNTVDSLAGSILEANLTADYELYGGSVEFSLSNDGGATWEAVTPGVNHLFARRGSELRWRVDLAADPLWPRGPLVHSLRIDYSALPPGADDYEVDDSCAQAQPIETAGVAQLHTFHAAEDEDWVHFDVTAGQIYDIRVNNSGVNADPALELYDTCGGDLIAAADNPGGHDAQLEWTATTAGSVTLRVRNIFGTSAAEDIGYELSVRGFDPSPIVILAAGEAGTAEQQAALDLSADLAYNTFRSAGVIKEHLRYFSPSLQRDVDGNGLDDDIYAEPGAEAIRNAIQDWARQEGAEFGIPVYIVLIGPGDSDVFYAAGLPEAISATDLNLWIANLEATSGADAVTVILEATKSGSFIDVSEASPGSISSHNRVVLTSTSSTLDSYLTAEGAIFSNALFNALGQDLNLEAAFDAAEAVVQASGLSQQPWIDDNGDALPDNWPAGEAVYALAPSAEPVVLEGLLAADRGLNTGHSMAPEILWLEKTSVAEDELQINARAGDDEAVVRVIGEVHACENLPYTTSMPVVTVDRFELEAVAGQPGEYRKSVNPAGVCWYVIYATDDEGIRSDPAVLTLRWRVYLPSLSLAP